MHLSNTKSPDHVSWMWLIWWIRRSRKCIQIPQILCKLCPTITWKFIFWISTLHKDPNNHHKFSHIFASRGQRWTCTENTYISGAKGYSEGVLCSLLHRDQIVIKNGKGACINKLAISYDLSKDVRNFEPLKISLCFNSTKRHSACRMENPLIQSTSLSPICVNWRITIVTFNLLFCF